MDTSALYATNFTTTTARPGPGAWRQSTAARRSQTPAPTPAPSPVIARSEAAPAARRRSDPARVKCHQCGSLFSGSTDSPSCDTFPASSKQDYCRPGEACLWYSWQLSEDEVSVIRECLPTDILLGPIHDPLTVTPWCQVKDISEEETSKVEACFCDSDLCNENAGQSLQKFSAGQVPNSIQPVTKPAPPPPRVTSSRPPATAPPRLVPASTPPPPPRVTTAAPVRNIAATSAVPPRAPAGSAGLRCYSCGSLLDPDAECAAFSQSDPGQRMGCGPGEACLFYSWGGDFTIRECISTSVLLGPITSPLLPEPGCRIRDVSDNRYSVKCNTKCAPLPNKCLSIQ